MLPGQSVIMLVGATRRDLLWTAELAAHWATVARAAFSVLSVTPTPTPTLWVDAAPHSALPEVARLAVHTATWQATSRWLALLTADLRLAETFLCLEVTRPVVSPVVIHFHLARHRLLLTHLARGGAFHLALEGTGQVIPGLSVGTAGLAEQLATAEALAAYRP